MVENLNKYIDHTILNADATQTDIERICSEALENDFMSVCINPNWVPLAAKRLKESDIKVCTVIGFPLGSTSTASKRYETEKAIEDGAEEVDMVINVGRLKTKDYDYVKKDIEEVVNGAKGKALVKVIIETCLLTDEEKVKACELAKEAGADFVKTSTGFSTGGATIEDVKLMRKTVGKDMGVKASGGVRSLEDALAFIEAGANRLGASSGMKIIEEYKSK